LDRINRIGLNPYVFLAQQGNASDEKQTGAQGQAPIFRTQTTRVVQRFPDFDEITETEELLEEQGSRTERQQVAVRVHRKRPQDGQEDLSPGNLFDLLA